MSKHSQKAPRPLVGLAAGVVAGLVAAGAMAAFQAAAAPIAGADEGDDDPATVKAADAVSVAATGARVPEPRRETAGQAVHYVTGAALGGVYGLLAEYRPTVASGFGSGYGLATSLLLDEAAVPAAGLADPPGATPIAVHLYGIAAHMVFGVALEATRALLGGRR